MAVHPRADAAPGAAQNQRGIGITAFSTALSVAVFAFLIQICLFLYLRKQSDLRYIYHPEGDGAAPKAKQLLSSTINFKDEEIIKRRGLDAYYFLRYLRTLLHLFTPILFVLLPILLPLNYVNGRGQDLDPTKESAADGASRIMGLDTLAFGNVRSSNTCRYIAHLVCALLVTAWFCYVSFIEMRNYEMEETERSIGIPERNREVKNQQDLVRLIEEKEKSVADDAKGLDRLLRLRNKDLAKFESAATALMRHESSSELQTKLRTKLQSCYTGLCTREKDIRSLALKLKPAAEYPKYNSGHNNCKHCSTVELAWHNVVWSNIGLPSWRKWLRATLVTIVLTTMIALWAIPVSWTAALSQLDNLIRNDALQSFFQRHRTWRTVAVAIAGVLPGAALTLMLMLLPSVLELLSRIGGAKLRSQQAAFVQRYYFVFLFVQMFLVVSIASFFTASFKQFFHNIQSLQIPGNILNLLPQNLPTAANYFFSYMILQALSGSSSIIMQWPSMFWFFADKIFVYTPRQKWSRGVSMDIVAWGAVFPLYTTLACISLIYSVIAPLILLFATVSFGMLWLAHRYSAIHVGRQETDHGGILYPRAINQTFTGIYVMQFCISGLFFGVRDETGRQTCLPHAIVMIAALVLTVAFQIALNAFVLPGLRSKCQPGRPDIQSECAELNDEFSNHLALLCQPKVAWVPDYTRLHKFNIDGVSDEFVCDNSDQSWRAAFDKRHKVQITKTQLTKRLGHALEHMSPTTSSVGGQFRLHQ
ncbi:DUF221 domain protein [Metarhizium robertsii ARSEF 23]|uniref:DUF221 domain protein n=1 Tax=Metarhizium robertsii (strain ARSEF 23 / ATCC MYA-3075) TaxID=655844 RepID=E9FDU1_METRA|nr:DUF221 domain protein [Metarhizium robertsii ARSEF 23]EFY94098.2 DUF221 domain protein [Metarhizium robertsii ARSEF 23]